ncbi:unnamed protein product [marine sediment metagenome]|uniref:Uncharacterized protein n=1 Tax=marine sediment metagenome TaxID=412755 RepID=X1LLR5_9ZZZZ
MTGEAIILLDCSEVREIILKAQALRREVVKVWRPHIRNSVAPHVLSQIMTNYGNDVKLFI